MVSVRCLRRTLEFSEDGDRRDACPTGGGSPMNLFVNGKEIEVPASAMEKRIVEFLREDLDLTGAKNACDIGACGACTILVNDEPNRICIKLVKDFGGQRILTIEGIDRKSTRLNSSHRCKSYA